MDDAQPSAPSRNVWTAISETADRAAGILTVIALLTVVAAAVFTIQGQARINQIVDCFSDYTTAYNTSSVERVAASENLEAAASANDRASVEWVSAVIALFDRNDPEGKALREATLTLQATFSAVQTAREDLQETRQENPFPAPCNVER